MPCWPMPAVRNLTHKGNWNTYCWVPDTSLSGHTVSSNGGKSKKFERWLCMRKIGDIRQHNLLSNTSEYDSLFHGAAGIAGSTVM
jgi:hypothetical protein